MADQNTETYILQLLPDQSAAQQTLGTINAVQDALAKTADQADQLSASSAALAGQYSDVADAAQQLGLTEDQLRAMVDDTSQLVDKNQALAQSYDQVASSASNASGAQQGVASDGGDSGDGGGFSLPSSRAFSAAGRLLGSQNGGQDISAIGSVVRLTAAFGPFGAALGLGLAGINAVTQAEQARAKAAQDAADAINNIAVGAAGGTTESINQNIQKQQANLDAQTQAQKGLQGYSDQLHNLSADYQSGTKTLAEYANGQEDLAEKIKIATGGQVDFTKQINDAAEALKNTPLTDPSLKDKFAALASASNDLQSKVGGAATDMQKNVDSTKSAIAGLNVELGTSSVAANDAAQMQKELTDALTKGQLQFSQMVLNVDQMTKDQRDTKLAADQHELTVLEGLIDNTNLTSDAHTALSNQYAQISDEITILKGVQSSYADGLKAEADAKQKLTTQNQNYLDALTSEGKIRDQISQDTQQMSQLRSDEQAKETTAATELQTKLTDIQAKGAQEQQKLATDNQDAIARILRDAASSEQDDIGNRDALKYQQDQQKAQQQIADQSASYKKQEDQLTTNLHDQENAAKQSEQNQLTQLQSALSQQEQVQNQKLQQDEVNLQNVLNTELAISNNSAGQIITAHETMWEQIGQVTGNWTARIVQQINQALGTNLTVGGLFNSGTPLPPITGTQTGIPDYATVNASLAAMAGALNGASGNRLVP